MQQRLAVVAVVQADFMVACVRAALDCFGLSLKLE